MTIFYQLLIDLPLELNEEPEVIGHFAESFYQELNAEKSEMLFRLLKKYSERLQANSINRAESNARMRAHNPRFILRNYLLHQAIQELEQGENQLFTKLQAAIKEPYSRSFDEFFVKRPDWASQKAGCSMLSCSS
ncbi:hypothetical protein [Adhaeribacter arboris]|uniref:hypothetical protein n=1 Tax=Adhaeribacter arboris TaxID=2072846 RepID=UPI001E4F7D3A|nr:hypothetical protein [Adhaeribacter arboris]